MKRAMRSLAALATAAALLVLSCNHSPTDPSDEPATFGRLAGNVTIGPNCPVETVTNPCPTPPPAFLARKILIYNQTGTTLLHTVDIDEQGLYVIALAPGKYLADLKKAGIDSTRDLPRVVEIKANVTTTA